MTHQLQTQQSELIEANRQLDQRRRFTETVLSGVSAGVIGLDHARPHQSAQPLGLAAARHRSRPADRRGPGRGGAGDGGDCSTRPNAGPTGSRNRSCSSCAAAAAAHAAGAHRRRARRRRGQGLCRHLRRHHRALSAQRKAAWADVARRIAHEIKNPLTPIQLSAERLKRKYLQATFTTIPRPSPPAPTRSSAMSAISAAWSTSSRPSRACRRRSSSDEDLGEIVRQTAFLQRTATSGDPLRHSNCRASRCASPAIRAR